MVFDVCMYHISYIYDMWPHMADGSAVCHIIPYDSQILEESAVSSRQQVVVVVVIS